MSDRKDSNAEKDWYTMSGSYQNFKKNQLKKSKKLEIIYFEVIIN